MLRGSPRSRDKPERESPRVREGERSRKGPRAGGAEPSREPGRAEEKPSKPSRSHKDKKQAKDRDSTIRDKDRGGSQSARRSDKVPSRVCCVRLELVL